jgi:hypothetical protein
MDINTYPYNCEPYKCEPYKCETCNYVTLVKKNLPNEERDKLLKYINDFDFIKN